MKQEEAKQLPKATAKPHPMLATLPAFLKDTKNYKAIQKAILEAGATKHSHSEIGEWASCLHCQQKEKNRLLMMKKLGFQSGAQYLAWKKVHEEIKRRNPLVNWNEFKVKV